MLFLFTCILNFFQPEKSPSLSVPASAAVVLSSAQNSAPIPKTAKKKDESQFWGSWSSNFQVVKFVTEIKDMLTSCRGQAFDRIFGKFTDGIRLHYQPPRYLQSVPSSLEQFHRFYVVVWLPSVQFVGHPFLQKMRGNNYYTAMPCPVGGLEHDTKMMGYTDLVRAYCDDGCHPMLGERYFCSTCRASIKTRVDDDYLEDSRYTFNSFDARFLSRCPVDIYESFPFFSTDKAKNSCFLEISIIERSMASVLGGQTFESCHSNYVRAVHAFSSHL